MELYFETPRLVIRPLTYADTQAVYELVHDEEVRRYLRMEPQTDITKTQKLMEDYLENPKNIPGAILDKETGDFIGAYIFKKYDHAGENYSITAFIGKPYWSKGIVREVFSGAIPWARRAGMRYLTSYVMEENIASNKMVRHSGFALKEVRDFEGCPCPVNIYELDLYQNDELQRLQQTLRPGIYQHFKGGRYQLLELARHSETEEIYVVYRALYGEGGLWVRPARMWQEQVSWPDGVTRPRFLLQEVR